MIGRAVLGLNLDAVHFGQQKSVPPFWRDRNRKGIVDFGYIQEEGKGQRWQVFVGSGRG